MSCWPHASLEYLVVDLHSSSGGLETLKAIRRTRPGMRLIVIGPEGNDELVMDSIMAGARAYLDLTAGPGDGAAGHRCGHRRLHLGAAAAALQTHRPAAQGPDSSLTNAALT